MDDISLSTLSSVVAVLAALVPVAAFVLVWARSGSLHLPLSRLWQLMLGTQEIQDPDIKKLINDQNDLMRFRLAFGLSVESMAHCRRLQAWGKAHSVEMGEVGACRGFFDIQQFAPRPPAAGKVLLRFGALMLSVLLLLPMPVLLVSDSALVKFKDSSQWFLLETSGARPIWASDSDRVTKETCQSRAEAGESQRFTVAQRSILCKLFIAEAKETTASTAASAELDGFVREALRTQRVGLAALVGALFLSAGLCVRWMIAFDAARRLKARLGPQGESADTVGRTSAAAVLQEEP